MRSEILLPFSGLYTRCETDHQRRLVPKGPRLLVNPSFHPWAQLNIKIPEYFGVQRAHLVVGETSVTR